MTEIDASQIRTLARDLDEVPERLAPDIRACLQKGALNIKRDWQARWQGLSHLPALASTVTYDTRYLRDAIVAEIGPDKARRQGPLGNVAEFGTVKNAPHPGGGPALAAEDPRFEKAIADIAGQALQ